ncbi:DUF6647 family protein [Pseudorhodoplanes sp.]|uniref:DUF6647 family protein n=1 Tax=Pseudorhodoplanes sp. TaxID=1934341 RepID=UPI00391DFAD1
MFAYPKALLIGLVPGHVPGRILGRVHVPGLALGFMLGGALALAFVPAKAMACTPAQGALQSHAADRCNAPEPADGRIPASQIDAITDWLADRFALPRPAERPAIVFESPETLARMRYGGFVMQHDIQRQSTAGRQPGFADGRTLYNDASRTIYLPEDWSGTDAEWSALVHALVHHLQTAGGLAYPCASDRESIAVQAQSAWLRQSAKPAASEAEPGGMNLLVRNSCL